MSGDDGTEVRSDMLTLGSETERTSSVVAEQDCVAWLLTPQRWEDLQAQEPDVAKEMLKVGLKLSAERMNSITSYVLITAS